MIKRETHIFFTAVMFYTRIPCPKWVDHDPDYLNLATRYFPLIGWIVGGLGAGSFYLSSLILPSEISILLSMIATILITGGFHEDGFADVCDGFGGGWTKDKILKIMKDSVLGAYGVIGLILILLLKYLSLTAILELAGMEVLCFTILASHTLSRTAPVWLIWSSEYARENEDSKAKPIAKQMSLTTLLIATFIGLLALLLFFNYKALIFILLLLLIKSGFKRYFEKWIGGYTGDCLGAVQQVSEVLIYISLLIIWKFI